jgi:hypothetical protein
MRVRISRLGLQHLHVDTHRFAQRALTMQPKSLLQQNG